MGYASLDAALAFPNNLPPTKSHIVITDTLKSDANFMIHHFVSNQLKTDRRVVLVGLAQIFNHYFLISRKLGTNLLPFKQSGQFVFIDGVTHLNGYTLDTPYPPAKAPTTPSDTLDGSRLKQQQQLDLGDNNSSSSSTNTQRTILQQFYSVIKNHIQQQQQPLVILDDASMLLLTGFGLENINAFINRIKSLLASVDGTLVTLIHADEDGTEDVEQDSFVKSMIQSSELVLQVQPLGSGLAKDVHGQLSVVFGPKYLPGSVKTQPQSMHYKILDNNVHFFAKGISEGVL